MFAPYAAQLPAGAEALRAARRRRRTASRRSTTATSASTSTPPGSPTTASRRRSRSTTSSTRRTSDLFVLPGAATSSTGLAFLLATIAEYGDDWPAYWTAADGQRRQAHRRLVRRLRGRLHPGRRPGRPADRAVLRLVAGLHRRRRHQHHARRCSTPASARSSTPACSPAPPTRRAPRRSSTACSRPRCRRRCPTQHVRLPRRRGRPSCRPTGRRSPSSPTTRSRLDPADIAAHRDEWLTDVERRHLAMRTRDAHRRLLARRRPCRWRCSASSSCCRSRAWCRCGFWPTARFDPGGVARGARPAASAPGAVVHALERRRSGTAGLAGCSACPRRTCSTAGGSRAGRVLRAALLVPFVLPTVVVGVAFRQLIGEGGPLGFLGLDGSAGRDRRRAGVLQRLGRDPRRRRRLGVARPATRPRPRPPSAPRRPRCCATVTLPGAAAGDRLGGQRGVPLLRHRVRRRAHPRRAALLARSRPRSTCSPPSSSTCRRRPRCRSSSWWWSPALLLAAARAASYGGPDGLPGRRRGPGGSTRGDSPALVATTLLAAARGRPDRSPWSWARCARTAPGAWPTTARWRPTGEQQALLVPGHRRRWSPRCGPPSTPPGCRCCSG